MQGQTNGITQKEETTKHAIPARNKFLGEKELGGHRLVVVDGPRDIFHCEREPWLEAGPNVELGKRNGWKRDELGRSNE